MRRWVLLSAGFKVFAEVEIAELFDMPDLVALLEDLLELLETEFVSL
jgi:hypothetical protein